MATQTKTPEVEGQNAIELLDNDHKEVEALFAAFEKLDDEDTEECERIVQQACDALTVHAEIEEQVFYPAFRAATEGEDEAEDLLDEAEVEHQGAKDLIAQLQEMTPEDRLYCAKFTVLSEYIKHHVKEERTEMFPKAKKSDMDLDAIGAQLAELKAELTADLAAQNADGKPAKAAPRGKTASKRPAAKSKSGKSSGAGKTPARKPAR